METLAFLHTLKPPSPRCSLELSTKSMTLRYKLQGSFVRRTNTYFNNFTKIGPLNQPVAVCLMIAFQLQYVK